MTEWFKQNLTLYSTPESRAASKLSALAIIEVIASVVIYWWIAAVWETQLHILVSLIAAPLYLLRSDESVTKAQLMWDKYGRNNTKVEYSLKFWSVSISAGLITGLISYFLSLHWLVNYQDWALFWRGILLGWLILNIAVAIAIMMTEPGPSASSTISALTSVVASAILGAGAGTVAVAEVGTAAVALLFVLALSGMLFMVLAEPLVQALKGAQAETEAQAQAQAQAQAGPVMLAGVGVGAGLWLRSLLIRIMAVLTSILKGVKSASINWQRSLWVEDFALVPELIPGVTVGSNHMFEGLFKNLRPQNGLGVFVISTFLLSIFFLPTLIWRLSLKSTVWFYAPIFLMSKPSDLAEADNRLRFFTRGPTLWEIWKMCFAVIGLTVAVISLIDIFVAFEFWRSLSNEAPLSPIGWLFVMDWERFFNQPWQWFSLPAAFLTVFLYLWVNQIRVHRDADIKLGQDPEVHNSAANHPGITIYWLDRLRNMLVVVSLVIGLWYFVKWAYLADKLTPIDPWLSSIFGPLPL